MKILILGSHGMLGNIAKKYFQELYEISVFDEKYTIKNRAEYLQKIQEFECDILLNCIGKIKQKTDSFDDLMTANALLPMDISNIRNKKFIFIHPSTDCIFSGQSKGIYSNNSMHDATDIYGISKSCGERLIKDDKNNLIIRTSIIGTTKNYAGAGIMDWFLSNPDDEKIKGYTNHLWNGITTLKWCEIVQGIIENEIAAPDSGVLQLASSKIVNKYDLLTIFQDIFHRKINIEPIETNFPINRSLESDLAISDIENQLIKFKKFLN